MIIILILLIIISGAVFLIYRSGAGHPDNILDGITRLIAMKKYEEAVETGLKYLKKNNSSYAMLQKIAQAYEGLYQYRRAIEFYEKSLVLLSKSIHNDLRYDIYNKIGGLYTMIRDQDSALGYYNLVLRENEHNMKALFFSAKLLYSQKDFKKSRERLETYLKFRPREIAPLLLLSNVRYELGEYRKSLEILHQLSTINDELVTLRDDEILMLSACNHMALGSYQEAMSFLKIILGRRSMLEKAVPLYIAALLRNKETDKAMIFYNDNGYLLNPEKKMELKYQIAQARFEDGEIYPAIELWREISEENPSYHDVSKIISYARVLLENPVLRNYYTTDETRLQNFVVKIFPAQANNIIKDREFWIVKGGSAAAILYLKANKVPMDTLISMGDSIMANALFNLKSVIYSLYGIEDICKEHDFYKSVREISGEQFINFFKTADRRAS